MERANGPDRADRGRLLEIVRTEALLRGTFTLASGKTSNVYLDCRRATLHPEGCVLTASLLLDWVQSSGLQLDCVGGPTLGADPIVAGMAALSFQRSRPLPGFLVRKEAKSHGRSQQLEGQWKPGWRALIVEDTVTTGGSLLKAVHATEEAGLVVAAVACLVDREEGGAAALAAYPFHALFRFAEVAGG
jgi:orotate phosphoribosyltransferase